jgi:hypothetical protein
LYAVPPKSTFNRWETLQAIALAPDRPLVLREVLVYPTLPFKPPVHEDVPADDPPTPPVRTYLPLYYESLNVAADMYIHVHGNEYVLREGIFKDVLQVRRPTARAAR